MAAFSSELLTSYRRLIRNPPKHSTTCNTHSSLNLRSSRPFSYTGLRQLEKTHATDRTDKLDVQSENAHKGKESRTKDQGGQATEERDTTKSTEQAKKEHPEAPDVVIGMQDERGGKGH
ncbi:hypothetical protein EV356DRAFT_502209 [Viridothelium virens]|uniref:Uncharacterized protein n=1 Tax=Viridothelium virens TaxID=1048519 RepID=A0A6A6HMY3_VIRVR|nr:hypothetical protein EV356DRAFT_502209 [Viridothelium virens]